MKHVNINESQVGESEANISLLIITGFKEVPKI